MKLKNILILAFLVTTLGLHAQKFGHINSGALMLDLPDVKQADKTLMDYQKSVEQDLLTKGEAFKKAYEAFMAKANSGEYSSVQLQKEQQALAKQQESMQLLQQDAQQKILKKREEIYAPIILKVEKAVQDVGKENGYTMIFDASMGSILHGQESNDITKLVKAKLGL